MFEHMSSLFEACKLPNTWSDKSYEYRYWFRSLLQKVDSCIDIKNFPEKWPEEFFRFCMWSLGFVGVGQSTRFGDKDANNLFFNPCTIGGRFNFYYQPTEFIISNPLYTKTHKIHVDGEIIQLTPDAWYGGFGIFDIIDWYAQHLAECSKGIRMGLINAKMPVIIGADNEAQSQKIKAIYDKVMNAETLIVYGENQDTFGDEVIPSTTPFDAWLNDFNHTYIVSQLLQDMKELVNQFYMEIGLPVPDTTAKKSHLLQDEVNFESKQSEARLKCWKNTLNECFRNIENTFGYKMEVEEHEEPLQNESSGDGTILKPEQRPAKKSN